ncbi:MAG: pirin family protein [Micrococcus sp.]|nr:pirin family protein [Micrococcus sp.]
MSNTDPQPQETLCRNGGPRDGVGNEEDAPQHPAPRFTEGLTSGVSEHHAAAPGQHTVEILEPRAVPLGGPRGMTVQRSLPQRARSLIGAWCFLDFYGPDDVAETGGMKVARHPHTGLATVSWLFEGYIDHIDSAGNWATVRPGEVHLMNAGTGITHSEHSSEHSRILHGAQLWYAFPDAARFTPPSLESHRPTLLTLDGGTARVFLGSLLGETSPVRTHLPLTGAEIRLQPGTTLTVDVPAEHEHGVLAVNGPVHLDGVTVEQAHVGFVGVGARQLTLTTPDDATEETILLLLGGQPLGEQIIMWWNFVGRSHEEIVEWRARYQQEMGFDDDAADGVDGALGGGTSTGGNDGGRMFGDFPPNQPDPLPAPELPNTRMRPRG